MPLENTLNVSPYFDDFDPEKEYYRILFKPGVAVQTRELNQLQTILQNQIERFGNHVFKSGTIVSGVNFTYLPNYSYVKILDIQVDGQPSLPSSYVGYFVKDSNNLTARVVNYQDGLESQTPDLKTLYVQYVSASLSACTTFAADQQLTVFSKNNDLFKITVNNGGSGFSNSDTVIVSGALVITDNTGTYAVGEEITQATTGAKAIIKSVNTTAISNTIILSIKPRTVDLKNTAVTSAAWTFVPGYNIVSNTTVETSTVSSVIGEGAVGLITTDSLGIIQTITMTEKGKDYTFLPHITVQTANSSATVNDLDLVSQNYLTTVTIGNSSINSVGAGYAFSVSEGVIYQKGLFLTVNNSVIVVDKYNTSPNNVVVGFKTVETFVDADEDDTLYDNASNTTNYSAPGADRLKLTPVLSKLSIEEAAANVDFFALAEWKEGVPYKENRVTVYNTLANEFARRTREAQGDFVVDPFYVSSREKTSTNTSFVDAVIDPGTGYISGYRVQTLNNGLLDLERSTTTSNTSNQTISINYGNYLEIKELAGIFNFKTGDQISLRDTAKQYITNATINTASITAPGNQIGTARIRSLVLDSGLPGTANAVYRLYLFDITMSAGKSFRDVRAVYYDGVQDGIADVVLTKDATTNEDVAIVKDITRNKMLFNLGQVALSNVTSVTYTIRTNSDTNYQLTTGGQITVGPLGTGETFPYSDGTLGTTQKRDIIVIPIANAQTANVTGGITAYANTTLDGSGTTFTSSFIAGDFVAIANSTATIYRQVATVANNTKMYLTTSGVAMTGNAANFYPALYPIALADRSDRSAAVSGTSKTLTITMNKTLSSVVNVAVIFNKTLTNQSPVTKSVTRDAFVKIHTSNNAGSNTGPWALGVPGALRLKNVYLGNSSTVSTSSTDITKYFFIDAGEDENAYRTAQLVMRRGATLALDTNSYMLVQFDAFRSSAEGFFTVGSYTINDSANLASLTSNQVNTLEIPEVITSTGEYYDHRDIIDFRPYASNTAALATSAASANVNPANTFALSGSDQLWPAPDSTVAFDARYYNKRIDRVSVNKDGQFKIVQGTPGILNVRPPAAQAGEITLSLLNVPQYPSIPTMMGTTTLEIASKKVGNALGVTDRRTKIFSIGPYTQKGVALSQPRRYSMADISKLERRLQNVEYISNLNQVEKSVKEKVIPSSITPTTSRFKHGFFVEPFEDYTKVDANHLEFNASIDGEIGLLKPATKQINFECAFDLTDANTSVAVVNNTTLMLPFADETLIDQTIKSAVVSSAGVRTQFVGEGTVAPPTFSIKTRGIVEEIPDPVNYDGTGSRTNQSGGGCGGGCFIADTLIEMADGTTKRIVEVQIGDLVKSADGSTTNKVVFIERATKETLPFLYTPVGKLVPFATTNHPLMIDGVLKAPQSDLYLWLDVEKLEECDVVKNEEKFVYNLWVEGDGTYRVNGYGTTSILGDGGALTKGFIHGVLSEDDVNKTVADMVDASQTTLYGSYLINKFFGMFDTTIVTKPLAYFACAPRGTVRRSIFSGVAGVVGQIAKALKV
jgi:hypothetical protein